MTLTIERLRAVLHYDPVDGKFRRQVASKWRKLPIGSETGWNDTGYICVRVDGINYYAHRLAWFYMTGTWPNTLDHIDGNGSNNRWSNLRLADRSENMRNRRAHRNNATGLKGVVPLKNKFQAQIQSRGIRLHLGTFKTANEAHQAYRKAAIELHGRFART